MTWGPDHDNSTDIMSMDAMAGSAVSGIAPSLASVPVSSLSAAIKKNASDPKLSELNREDFSEDIVTEGAADLMSTNEKVGNFLATLADQEEDDVVSLSLNESSTSRAASPMPVPTPTSSTAPISIPSPSQKSELARRASLNNSLTRSGGSPLARFEPLVGTAVHDDLGETDLAESNLVPSTRHVAQNAAVSPVVTSTATAYVKIEISLCGRNAIQALLDAIPRATPSAPTVSKEAEASTFSSIQALFTKYQVPFEAFCVNPAQILYDPSLVFRIDGSYYDWTAAAPILVAVGLNGGKGLTKEAMKKIMESVSSFVPDQVSRPTSPSPSISADPSKISTSPSATVKSQEPRRYTSFTNLRYWWSRGATASPTPAAANDIGRASPPPPLGIPDTAPSESGRTSPTRDLNGNFNPESNGDLDSPTAESSAAAADKSKTKENGSAEPPRRNYVKSLRLTSDQLKALNLKKGVNTVTFSVTSRLQGTATCTSKIFYWDHDTKVVISDVDGTITKSDVLGHVFTMVGRDWTHSGVASLYTNIRKNGYQILYLTSRAIGQAEYTRDYLKKIEQGSYQLPDGPVIMSPDRLFTAFHR
jgi:phosphatidate phosphatase LPIN